MKKLVMDKINLIECHNRIKPYIHNTPVITSTQINNMTGAEIYFKCDNFQKMGAFKMRGATNAVLQLPADKKRNGVVTHSSGNFGQALSLAAQSIGVKAYIVMPSNATEIKKAAVKGDGGGCHPRDNIALSWLSDELGVSFNWFDNIMKQRLINRG